MLRLLRLLLACRRPISARIYPPGVPLDLADQRPGRRVHVVIDLG